MDLFSLLKKGGKPSSPVKQHFPGCIELHGSRPAYNADANPSKLASIPVTEVTAVKSDPIRSRGKRVAANDAVRCYAVKNFIRVLGSSGDQRTLLRGHTAPVVDLVFLSPSLETLMSLSSDGVVFVWRVYAAASGLKYEALATIISDPDCLIERIAWFPNQPTVVLLSSRLRILPVDLAEFGVSKSTVLTVGDVASGVGGVAVDPAAAPKPDVIISLGSTHVKTRLGCYATCNTSALRPAATGGASLAGLRDADPSRRVIQDFTVSDDGTLIVAGCEDGSVIAWTCDAAHPLLRYEQTPSAIVKPFGASGVDAVRIAPRAFTGEQYRIIIGASGNTVVAVMSAGVNFRDPNVVQTLSISSAAPMAGLLEVAPDCTSVLIADSKAPRLLVIPLDTVNGYCMASIVEFGLKYPVLSVTTRGVEGGVSALVMQTDAVQQYDVNYAAYFPAPVADVADAAAAAGGYDAPAPAAIPEAAPVAPLAPGPVSLATLFSSVAPQPQQPQSAKPANAQPSVPPPAPIVTTAAPASSAPSPAMLLPMALSPAVGRPAVVDTAPAPIAHHAAAPAPVLTEETISTLVNKLGEPLQAQLEGLVLDTVLPKVATLVKDTLLHTFKASFVESVVPATEKALQSMFHQVGDRFEAGVARIVESDATARADARALLAEVKSATHALNNATATLQALLTTTRAFTEEQAAATSATRELMISVADSVRVASIAAVDASAAAAQAANIAKSLPSAAARHARRGSTSTEGGNDDFPPVEVLVPPEFENQGEGVDDELPLPPTQGYQPANDAADVEQEIAELGGTPAQASSTMQDVANTSLHFLEKDEEEDDVAVATGSARPSARPSPPVEPAVMPASVQGFFASFGGAGSGVATPATSSPLVDAIQVVPPPSGRAGLSALASQARLGECEQAFTSALNLADLELVTWVAYIVATSTRDFTATASGLSGIIQLCLVQQLSQSLTQHTVLKLKWLEALCAVLKRNDPVVAPHAPAVLAELKKNINELLTTAGAVVNVAAAQRVIALAEV